MESPSSESPPPAVPPVRTCVACRRAAPRSTLLRLVVREGAVTADARGRLPGRGAYLCHRPACLQSALAHGGARLARALRFDPQRVTVEEEELTQQWKAAVSVLRRRGVCT